MMVEDEHGESDDVIHSASGSSAAASGGLTSSRDGRGNASVSTSAQTQQRKPAPAQQAQQPQPQPLDLRWLFHFYACRLNRHSLDASANVGAKFVPLELGLGLRDNNDVMAAKAEALYCQHDAGGALELTKRVIAADPFHRRAALLHYGLLLQLKKELELFELAHAAVDTAPKGESSL